MDCAQDDTQSASIGKIISDVGFLGLSFSHFTRNKQNETTRPTTGSEHEHDSTPERPNA